MSQEPKDYQLAKRAYEAYHNEQPQVWFEDLNHIAQMKWVRVVRAVIGDYRNKSFHGRPPKVVKRIITKYDDKTDRELVASAPRKPSGRIDHARLSSEESNRVTMAMQRINKRKMRN